jgi:hypothetical protein
VRTSFFLSLGVTSTLRRCPAVPTTQKTGEGFFSFSPEGLVVDDDDVVQPGALFRGMVPCFLRISLDGDFFSWLFLYQDGDAQANLYLLTDELLTSDRRLHSPPNEVTIKDAVHSGTPEAQYAAVAAPDQQVLPIPTLSAGQ